MQTRSDLKLLGVLVALACSVVLAVATPALAYTISGKVTAAASAQPVVDIELQLWKYSSASSSWVRPGLYAGPGADGTYAFNFYDEGQYRVQCYNSSEYLEQWWHGAGTIELATTLTVPGDTLTGIDFALLSSSPRTETSLTLAAPGICAYESASLTGYLKDAGGKALGGKTVTIEYSASGVWTAAGGGTTDAAGLYSFAAKPGSRTTYRAVFAEDATFAGATSAEVVVLPRVSLTKPSGPATARTTTTFTSSFSLKPLHAAGTYPVSIQCKHLEAGKWVTKKTVKAKAANYSTYTKCSARIRLSKKGSWRILAVHAADALNASTTSVWRAIKVK